MVPYAIASGDRYGGKGQAVPSRRAGAEHPRWPGTSICRANRDLPSLRAGSGEFHDHGIDGKTVAGLGLDGLDDPIALGAQDILHFHGLNDT